MFYELDIATEEWKSLMLPTNGFTYVKWGPDNNSIIYAENSTDLGPGIYQFDLARKKLLSL